MTGANSNAMGIGMIVSGLFYMLFKNLAIDYIWTMLSMIQLVSHIVNF